MKTLVFIGMFYFLIIPGVAYVGMQAMRGPEFYIGNDTAIISGEIVSIKDHPLVSEFLENSSAQDGDPNYAGASKKDVIAFQRTLTFKIEKVLLNPPHKHIILVPGNKMEISEEIREAFDRTLSFGTALKKHEEWVKEYNQKKDRDTSILFFRLNTQSPYLLTKRYPITDLETVKKAIQKKNF